MASENRVMVCGMVNALTSVKSDMWKHFVFIKKNYLKYYQEHLCATEVLHTMLINNPLFVVPSCFTLPLSSLSSRSVNSIISQPEESLTCLTFRQRHSIMCMMART